MTGKIEFDPEQVELNAAKLVILADDLSTAANKPEVCSAYTGIDVSWTNEFHSALQNMVRLANQTVRGTQEQAAKSAQVLRETKEAFEEQENANISDLNNLESGAVVSTASASVPAAQQDGQGKPPGGKVW